LIRPDAETGPLRSYEYVLPTFAFDPSVGMARDDVAETAPTSGFVFDDGVLARLNTLLARYVGTHNFHNFTVKARFLRSVKRTHAASDGARLEFSTHAEGVHVRA
jgi:tRNA U38,U39,U40 pseudouridine synthase TruA